MQDVPGPVQADVLRLDGDAALTLEVHRVEVLRSHVARVDRSRELENAVGERRFPVVDVRHDAEIPESIERRHSPIVVAPRPSSAR